MCEVTRTLEFRALFRYPTEFDLNLVPFKQFQDHQKLVSSIVHILKLAAARELPRDPLSGFWVFVHTTILPVTLLQVARINMVRLIAIERVRPRSNSTIKSNAIR